MKRYEINLAQNRWHFTAPSQADLTNRLKVTAVVAFATALAACGGGGDSGSASTSPGSTPNAPSTSVKYTQADAQAVAAKGANAILFTGTRVGIALGFLGGIVANSSHINSGNVPTTTVTCAGGGGYTYSFTKSAVRTGFVAGDQLVFNYNNCTASGVTVNGTTVLTLQNAVSAASFSDYDVVYEAKLTNFTVRALSISTTLNGTGNVGSRLVALNSTTQKLSVPAGQSLKAESNGGGVEYKSGSSLSLTEVTTPQSAQYELKGDVVLTKDGKTTALQISTPVAVKGIYPNQRFEPTSGTLTSRDTTLRLTTSTTLAGTSASVSGDSDDNGSMDLSFATTWNLLVQ